MTLNKSDSPHSGDIEVVNLNESSVIKTVLFDLVNNRESRLKIYEDAFPPIIKREDTVVVQRSALNGYKKGDTVIYTREGLRFGKFQKLTTTPEGLAMAITPPNPLQAQESILHDDIIGKVVAVEREGKKRTFRPGMLGKLLEMLGI
jgi:hypothetical protein